ncbi:type I polyketide synthase [Clostridium hydrogenum]|uniref:type I polyketide synthase n=1 Tax=Clostridium hydrogenum TaxID=2855764 RepID=UPI001F459A03|nr:type I polyketide synthase [Clostridium hydrogenum]
MKKSLKNYKNKVKLSYIKGNTLKNTYYEKKNIGNLLIEAASSNKEQGIVFIDETYKEKYLSYKEIFEKAVLALGVLQKKNIQKGDYVLLMVQDNLEFVINFWACVLGGFVVVPLSHPTEFKAGNSSLEKLMSIWETLDKPILIVDEGKKRDYEEFTKSDKKALEVIGTQELINSSSKGKLELREVTSPAFIQFSSGSTNAPKGIVLSHENILINIESMINRLKINSEDTIVNWMPFSHDMGLIGFHILQIAAVSKIIQLSTISFIKNPTIWLDLITKYKGTVTCCPNFGYKLLLPRLTEEKLKNWDLKSIRVIINGAEPISENLVKLFLQKLEVCGLNSNTMNLAYGMAEATLAITISETNSKSVFYHMDRDKAAKDSKVELVKEEGNSLVVADLGKILDGMELRIVDNENNILEEKHIGQIQIKGKNVTRGYLKNESLNKELFVDGWLKTGDMGFISNGKLAITGRFKDIIFINGQNFYSHDIEERIEGIKGIEPSKIAVCGYHNEIENKERVVLFSNLEVKNEVYAEIISFVSTNFGFNLDDIVMVKAIPKTNSGKIQRFSLLKDFMAGKFKETTYKASKFLEADVEIQNENSNYIKNEIENSPDSYIDIIRAIWSKVLEVPEEIITEQRSFLSFGGNSIKAIQLLSYLEESLNIELSHDILIKCHTVSEMNEYLLNKFNVNKSEKKHIANRDSMKDEDIAVISMSAYLPGAENIDEFWNNIKNGKSSIAKVPESRFDIDSYYSSNAAEGKTYSDKGAFIDNPYSFDCGFFNISEEEASIMDPQQRLILELVFKVLESAGYSKEAVDGKNIGMFVGAGTSNYLEYHLNNLKMNKIKEFSSFNTLTKEQKDSFLEEWKSEFGMLKNHPNVLVDNINNMIAARVSHEYNFKGPSLTIDTACSSALVTIHMACEAMRNGECDMALAGGVNLLLTPIPYIYFSNAGALSKSGESRVFDALADGFVPGEGAGIVLLKPLKKAVSDKDEILAVIKASAVNNDGRSIGVMAPNPDGQREVIQNLYEKSSIDPREVQYVEAHGTGTKIGDPSEVRALSEAYSSWKPESKSIAIGSVKANIGHLLNAAGIASFIKVVLALKNKELPPSINVTEPNPLIKFEKTPFYLLEEAEPWKVEKNQKRKAAINSFGFGGTNCHMVLEEAPIEKELKEQESRIACAKNVLCLGAQDEEAFNNKVINLKNFLKVNKEIKLGDICLTENTKVSDFKLKGTVIAENTADLIDKLDKLKAGKEIRRSNKIAFMFTGQGSQYINMAKEIYEAIPEFKACLDKCSEAFYPYIKVKVTDLIYGENCDDNVLKKTSITQPVVFSIDYSLGRLLIEYGIKPECLLGHSIGEWAAAAIAEVVTLEEAARLVSLRGKLMGEIAVEGSMAAVFINKDTLVEIIDECKLENLWIAAFNGSHQVVSGSSKSIDEFASILEKKGVVCKKLRVSQAFHTPLMKPMLAAFESELKKVQFKTPKIKIVSNITGNFIDKPITAEYWLEHVLSSVKFEQSISFINNQGINTFVECGPDKILTGMASAVLSAGNSNVIKLLDRKKDCLETFFTGIGTLHCATGRFDWKKLYENYGYKKIKLPLYPFNKKVFSPQFSRSNNALPPKEWFHKFVWEEENKIVEKELKSGAVIIFEDEKGVGRKLGNMFDVQMNPVYFVKAGSEFNYDDNDNFTINKKDESDYKRIFNEIPYEVTSIIYLWTLDNTKLDEELYETFYSLLLIGQTVEKIGHSSIDLVLVTDGAQKVNNKDTITSPYLNLSAKIVEAMDEDMKTINSKVIDVKVEEYGSKAELANTIFNELTIAANEEHIVAIRNNKGFQRKLEAITEREDNIEINDGDTFVITGGTGPLGGEIACALSEKAKIKLALLGRTNLPAPEEIKGNINPLLRDKLNLIEKLRKLGAEVEYFAVDVTDYEKMKICIQKIKDKFGEIKGVIHAAGVVDYTELNFSNKTFEGIEKVLLPKVKGTIVIDKVTESEPLKFFAMFSSVSASKKSLSKGLGDYAAANAFLNSYSIYRQQNNAKGRTVSINYSLWKDKGMVNSFGKAAEYAAKIQGLLPLETEKAVGAFFKALAFKECNNVHVINFHKEEKENNKEEKLEIKIEKEPQILTHAEIKENKASIYKVIAEVLKIEEEQLELDTNFMDLGLDSIGAVKIMTNLSSTLNKELYPTLIFEYQTPRALANYIEEEYFTANEAREIESDKYEKKEVLEKNKENDDIAIIGMSLRIPGADNLEEYWDILNKGEIVVKEIPEDRWSKEEEYSSEMGISHKTYTKYGGFINNLYGFDPLFFGISPKEAEVMDPQQRIFLEVAFEALQGAGYIGKYKTNKIGVFVGCEQNGYMEHFLNYRSYKVIEEKFENSDWFNSIDVQYKEKIKNTLLQVLKPKELISDSVAGNGLNEVASRVSHCLNLVGPSLSINTACSSSLVALHLACENLRSNPDQMAIVGGVNLNTNSIPFISMSRLNAISKTGSCRPFDKAADGMILSEGVGAIVIKPLSKAVEDNDNIYAVIKGSAISNDGHSQGITAPNPNGQAIAIEQAYRNAGINPETVSYIEAHGTGTPLGDPIEIQGMTKAFRAFTDKNSFCNISSVKASIGHMLSASGLVSLIKVVLAMKHNTIPKVANFENPNDNINFKTTPFVVAKENVSWTAKEGEVLRAGVNAFGFGGTNAHIVLEEAPSRSVKKCDDKELTSVLQITGGSEAAVKKISKNLINYINNNPNIAMEDICSTMNENQKQLSYRMAIIAASREEFIKKLEAALNGELAPGMYKYKANPKKEAICHLLYDGNLKMSKKDIESLQNRYKAFDEAYSKCIEEYENIRAMTKIGKESYEKLQAFFLEYSFGVLIKNLEIKIETIVVRGLGILSGAVLTGKISINQAINIILEENICTDWNNKAKLACPLVTEQGILNCPDGEEVLYVLDLTFENGLYNNLSEIVKEKQIVLYFGDDSNLKEELVALNLKSELVNENSKASAEENLLLNLGKLYVLNVGYNPKNIYQGCTTSKVVLPTYPFENKEYKITFKKDTFTNFNIKKIEDIVTLSPKDKQESAYKLSRDLKLD